ncbi:MAG: hypothetical protein Q7T55_26335 [Solirubrobacteraceae bacterium]|nr:hypothetical protein [Solirubrobacteraceae bacterium]
MTGRRTASALPRLLPELRPVGCAVCGTTQLVPTWNEPEPEPPLIALTCTANTCQTPFNTAA